jgi:acyl carrier protein
MSMDELRMLIADVMDIDEEAFEEGTHFVEDLGVSSLTALEVAAALERRYGVKIAEGDIGHLISLRKVYEFLTARLTEGRHGVN